MAGRDPYRRVYGTPALRRVGGGQEQFDKESLEGPAESPTAAVRAQRQLDAPLNPGRKSFASSLERFATPPKKK
ncbi:hypothetical protein [Melittangium boletus]|uniref:Uncharacterized protein n=1 Tax=Melittangium boletus DSM 14713 TaxID=1294270 RepID=A0A250IEC7_9BACT|nr:hypothetical protein [Melittangium boletus]ATB29598.1 hypothetical protein MEBOL_003053 [Melittangium boletus DSM 14713]